MIDLQHKVENYFWFKKTNGQSFPLRPKDVADIINLVDDGLLSSSNAKVLFQEMIKLRGKEIKDDFDFIENNPEIKKIIES